MVLLACWQMLSSAPASACELTIRVRGVGPEVGVVRIALFDSEDSYERSDARKKPAEQGAAFKDGATEVRDNTAMWAAGEIPCGRYAAAAYHDANANNRLDSNFFGKPKEDYGFSKGVRNRFGKPSFEEIAFTVKVSEEITITVK